MKKVVQILLAILMVMCLALGFAACKSDCEKGNHDKYVKTEDAATCTTAKVEHWACHNCDWTDDVTVGKPLGHDLSAWTASATNADKHERTCSRCDYMESANHTTGAATCPDCGKDLGGGTVIPHDHVYETWTPTTDGSKHQATCTVEGCGHVETAEHRPNEDGTACLDCKQPLGEQPHTHTFDETIVANVTIVSEPDCTEKGSKTVKCSGCDEVKTVEIPALGHDYTGVDWAPSTQVAGKHFRTCTREGCGYIERADHTPEVVKGTPATCTTAGTKDGSKCSACDAVITVGETINPLGHTWQAAWQSDDNQHWHKCVRCDATSTKQNHDFGENDHDLVCTVCDTNRPGENYVLTYEIDGQEVQQSYQRLADAVAFIAENQDVNNVIINVNDNDKELEGLGVAIPGGLTITIDLHGSTYIIASDPVGSTGTATCGFQILANSNITIKNGTITSQAGSGVKMLIQNYANLTLEGVKLDGRNLDLASNAPNYTLSNNCGTVNIRSQSEIIARAENGVALDVWYNMGGNYPDGVSVTVGKTCTITGTIEYGSAQEGADLKNKAILSLPAGTYDQLRFTSNVVACIDTGITIDGKALTANWGEWTTVEDHAPTCENEGLAERFCKLCGLRDTKPLAKTSHTMDTAEYVGGHQHEGVCTVCGHTETVDCTEVNYSCTVCGRELHKTRPVNVTIDTREQDYGNEEVVTSIKSGRLTVTLDKGTSSYDPKYFTSGTAIRLYGGNKMTIAVPEKSIITKITIGFGEKDGANAITVDNGSFKNNVWTGSADSVVFTIGGNTGNRRIQTITVEYTVVECNHFYGEWEIDTDETCTEDGLKIRECLDCGVEDTEEIPAHHTLGELVARVEPDCKTQHDGHVAYYQCEECDKYFEDAEATTEILEKDIDIKWEHDFEVIPEVEATVDSNGKQSYNHCTVCEKNYELDGTTPITNLESWGVITYDCAHEEHEWKTLNGQHVYVCSNCGKDQQKAHNPSNGTWSTAINEEGTEVHTLPCGGHADCPYIIATHNADYAGDYTVSSDGDHVQACKGANCTLVKADTKHGAQWGDYALTADGTMHYQECDECDLTSAPVAHEISTYAYTGNGKHSGECVCGKTVEGNCNSDGDDNACTDCGRIVGSVNDGGEGGLTAPATSITSDTNADTLDYISGEVTFVLTQNNSTKNGFNNSELRFYQNNTLAISVSSGHITTIVLTGTDSSKKAQGNITVVSPTSVTTASTNNGLTLTITNNDVTVNEIIIKASAQVRLTSITVTYDNSFVCYHEGENVLVHKTVTPATCESAGIKRDCYYCTACDTYFTTQACTAIVTKANAVAPATGHTYGELIKQREGTCQDEPYFCDHYVCKTCGAYFVAETKEKVDKGIIVGALAEHTWDKWTDKKDGTHTRTCSFGVHTENGNCTYDANVWEHDNDMHWHECPLCGHMFEEDWDEHDGMGDGICDTCGYSSTAVTVSVSVDGGAESLVTHTLPKQAEVGKSITFTVSVKDGYRVVSVNDYVAETAINDVNGTYTYTFTEDSVMDDAVLINIVIIKQVTITASADEGVTVKVEVDSKELSLPATVDVGTSVKVNVSLSAELAETKILKSITYTLTGGNAQTINNGDNIAVNENAVISVTIGDIPKDPVLVATLTFGSLNTGGYSNSTVVTCDKTKWTVVNFNTNNGSWSYGRAGAKSSKTGTVVTSTATISTEDISQAVRKVIVTYAYQRGTASIVLTKVKNGTTIATSSTVSITSKDATSVTFDLTDLQTDCEYIITITCENNTTTNGCIDISKVEYWA